MLKYDDSMVARNFSVGKVHSHFGLKFFFVALILVDHLLDGAVLVHPVAFILARVVEGGVVVTVKFSVVAFDVGVGEVVRKFVFVLEFFLQVNDFVLHFPDLVFDIVDFLLIQQYHLVENADVLS